MFYTIAFYIILYITTKVNQRNYINVIKAVCAIIAIYTGIRYDYCSDYPSYQAMFEMFSNPNFVYTDTVHVEYGWYLINKWCIPIGYYGFVFLTSCIFAYGIYVLMSIYVKSSYIAIVILGIVSAGGFTTLLSAQRQMLVTAVFMIAYGFLLYGRINKKKDILKTRTILYFLIIFLCSYFHKSAYFLLVIPFIFLLPKRSNLVIFGIVLIGLLFVFVGDSIIAPMFQSFSEENEFYDYIEFTADYGISVTLLQSLMWFFQLYYILKVYKRNDMTTDEMVVLLLSIFAILITLLGYYLNQVGRIALYIYVFTYLTIPIVSKYNNQGENKVYLIVNYIWVIWNLLKIFTINIGTYQEYKTIFRILL